MILARVADGDEEAVRQCMDRFGPLVWALARRWSRNREDAADAVQDIFIEVWKNAGRFDAAKASEKTFIAMIARRRLIDKLRRQGRRPKTATIDEAFELAEPDRPDLAEQSDEVARVREQMAKLRPEQRNVLQLAVREGWSHSRISEHLGLPLGTVKTHVRRGLIKVREMLGVEKEG